MRQIKTFKQFLYSRGGPPYSKSYIAWYKFKRLFYDFEMILSATDLPKGILSDYTKTIKYTTPELITLDK